MKTLNDDVVFLRKLADWYEKMMEVKDEEIKELSSNKNEAQAMKTTIEV